MSARFDSVYAPDGPIYPLMPPAVKCEAVPGAAYIFDLSEGGWVPALLTGPILFPECGPYITSPAPFTDVTLEGLELIWTGYDTYPDCDRPVVIRIKDMSYIEWTDVYIETENDGAYTFTGADVSGIDPMAYQLIIVLIVENKRHLTYIHGYDPRSWISARVHATQWVNISP